MSKIRMKEIIFTKIEEGNTYQIREMLEKDHSLFNLRRAYDDNTLLHVAVKSNHSDLVRHLLCNGANINAKNSNGWTPLHIAAMYELEDMFFILVSAGADINIKNNDGKTCIDIMRENFDKDEGKI